MRRPVGRPPRLADFYSLSRRHIPRFAHESDEISKAVYQALPLCIVAAL
jgi:hypothetical protein